MVQKDDCVDDLGLKRKIRKVQKDEHDDDD